MGGVVGGSVGAVEAAAVPPAVGPLLLSGGVSGPLQAASSRAAASGSSLNR